MKRNRARARYPGPHGTPPAGILAKPVDVEWKLTVTKPSLTGHPHDVALAELAYNDAVFRQRSAKFPELFAYFGIDQADENAWPKLAYRLACTYVPGFQVARRTPQAGAVDPFIVHRAVHAYLRENPGVSIVKACEALTVRGQPLQRLSAVRARRMYTDRNKRLDKILDDAAQYDAMELAAKGEAPG